MLSGEKHRTKGRRSQGAKDHRRGCTPPAPDRREEPPGHDSLIIVSPEPKVDDSQGATEYVTCIITTCLCLCRPFGAFSFVAILPGVHTPVCALSSLRDFWQAPISCYSSETPMGKDLKGRGKSFYRTPINGNPYTWESKFLQQGKAIPTARKSNSHSKERRFPQQGKAIPTARKIGSFVWEILIACNPVRQVKARATYFCLIEHQIVTQSTYKRA